MLDIVFDSSIQCPDDLHIYNNSFKELPSIKITNKTSNQLCLYDGYAIIGSDKVEISLSAKSVNYATIEYQDWIRRLNNE